MDRNLQRNFSRRFCSDFQANFVKSLDLVINDTLSRFYIMEFLMDTFLPVR